MGYCVKSILTTCGYCGCGCNFYAHVEQNRIVSVSPKADHPVNGGMLCAKGWLGHDFASHGNRLTSPKLRQDDGTFKDVSWEEAFDFIAQKLRHVRHTHPASFGLFSSARCTNEENYLAAKLCRSVMASPHIDHCARL